MDTTTARKRFDGMLADLDRSIEILRNERPGESLEKLANYDQHPADAGSDLSDADRAEALLEACQRQRTYVTDAIDRVHAGTYGLCVDCGQPVAEGRLEARPDAARCVNCQSKAEKKAGQRRG